MNHYPRLFVPIIVCAVFIYPINPPLVYGDSFSVNEWFLVCGAQKPSASEYSSVFFDAVQNPFVNQHSVSLPSDASTTAAAQYLIEWMTNYGSIHIASQQQATGSASGTVMTRAAGSIRITPSEPLPLHIDAAWTYNLPKDYMESKFQIYVHSTDSQGSIYYRNFQPGTMPGESASGTITVQDDMILLPGLTWFLSYDIRLFANTGTLGHSATSDGYINFTITPEPATVALLAPLSLLGLRRRRA